MSRALWAEPSESHRAMMETFTAVSLMDLTAERKLERAVMALMERASAGGPANNARANIESLNSPFFRVSARERLALVALHVGHWSYPRLARVLGISIEETETLAWRARVQLGAQAGRYPIGSAKQSTRCPDYDLTRPWTQRFFDEELKPQERVFIQNHLMACASCREAINRCRDIYYAVDAALPKPEDGEESWVESLERMLEKTRGLIASERGVLQTFTIFFRRWDVRVAVALLVGTVLAKLFQL